MARYIIIGNAPPPKIKKILRDVMAEERMGKFNRFVWTRKRNPEWRNLTLYHFPNTNTPNTNTIVYIRTAHDGEVTKHFIGSALCKTRFRPSASGNYEIQIGPVGAGSDIEHYPGESMRCYLDVLFNIIRVAISNTGAQCFMAQDIGGYNFKQV